jgi:peptidoglycan hydrolase-like protein with peptidoglycan-binding domain
MEEIMQIFRATLISSSFVAGLALSGLALAADAPPARGGVPHAEATPAQRRQASADNSQVKVVHVTPDRERTMEMQRALTARNLYQGKADGVWGPKTENALRNFQTQNGLDATGRLDQRSAEALGLAPERQPVSGTDLPDNSGVQNARPQNAPVQKLSQPQLEDASTNVQLTSLTTEQAKEMQQRLQLLGYYRGTVDGVVGEGTRVALQRFFNRQAELASKGVVSNAAISLFGTEPNDVQPVKGTDKDPHQR